MDRNKFWQIIDSARDPASDIDKVAAAITKSLEGESPDEIVSFKQHQWDLLAESYRWDLWAVAYIVNGGCSDDGFDYFRAWLMVNGSERWKAAMDDPECVGDWAEGEEADYEDMLYVAVDAYRNKTGDEFPYSKLNGDKPTEPAGESWDEDQLEKLYPTLYEKYA